jgi:hypothetical protein
MVSCKHGAIEAIHRISLPIVGLENFPRVFTNPPHNKTHLAEKEMLVRRQVGQDRDLILW